MLNSFYTESNNALVSASNTLIYVTSAEIESWKGTMEAFIIHWKDQILVHEVLVPIGSHFSEHQKSAIIEIIVASIGPLRAIKDQYDQQFSHSG